MKSVTAKIFLVVPIAVVALTGCNLFSGEEQSREDTVDTTNTENRQEEKVLQAREVNPDREENNTEANNPDREQNNRDNESESVVENPSNPSPGNETFASDRIDRVERRQEPVITNVPEDRSPNISNNEQFRRDFETDISSIEPGVNPSRTNPDLDRGDRSTASLPFEMGRNSQLTNPTGSERDLSSTNPTDLESDSNSTVVDARDSLQRGNIESGSTQDTIAANNPEPISYGNEFARDRLTEENQDIAANPNPTSQRLDRAREERFRMVAVNPDSAGTNNERQQLETPSETALMSHYDRGTSLQKEGNYQAALSEYRLALASDSQYTPAIINIALIEYEEGEIDRAILKWHEIVQENPDRAEAKLALAAAFYQKGRKFEAFRMARSALNTNESFRDKEYLKENLWGDRLISDTEIVLSKLR